MTTLHIVRQSAYITNDFQQCVQVLKQGDSIVLIDDGCYNVNHSIFFKLNNHDISLYILKKHAQARSITYDITEIDMASLVNFTFENDTVITWQ